MAFLTVRKKDIAWDLRVSISLPGSVFNNCLRHVLNTKFYLSCPTARSVVETETKSDFDITHLQNLNLLFSVAKTAVLLLQANFCNVIFPDEQNSELPAKPLYSATAGSVTYSMPSLLHSVTLARNGSLQQQQGPVPLSGVSFPTQNSKPLQFRVNLLVISEFSLLLLE